MSKMAQSRSVARPGERPRGAAENDSADGPKERPTDRTLADAYTQIREARDRIVEAVIQRAIDEGSYQHAKWLFEFGGILPEGQKSPADEPSLVRLLLEKFQIPEDEYPSGDQSNEFSSNDAAVE